MDYGRVRGNASRRALLLALLALAVPRAAAAQAVASWEASIATLETPRASGRTVRQFARVTVGGSFIRLRFSNETGTKPLSIADAHVALPGSAPGSVDPGSDHLVTFNSGRTVTVAPGAVALSDYVAMPVQPLTRLAVSAYFQSASPVQVGHLTAYETNFLAPGDHAGEATMAGATTATSGFYLGGISVVTGNLPGGVVACLGDSITDGVGSTLDAEHRYPDYLAQRLLAATQGRMGAIDAGLSGNTLLGGNPLGVTGVSASSRLMRDVLNRPGVHWMILFEGINDIIYPPVAGDTAAEIIAADAQLIAQAHEVGIKVFGATLTPFAGTGPNYYSAAKEAQRQRVNAWIRTSGAFDAVFDFDAIVRTPSTIPQVRAIYDGGDHLHLNDAGYAALADSIPLNVILRGK